MSRLVNVLESRKERAFETYVLGVISERPTIVDRWSSETNDRLLTQVFNSRPVDSSWASESVVNLARNTEQLVRRGSSLKGFHQDLSVGYIAACKEFGVYLASVYLYFMQAEPKNGVITVRSFLDLLQELIDLEET